MKQDIILSGVGGQGILSIATIIGEAATQAGLTLKQAEVHGMSQRGGDVQSNLRLSDGEIASLPHVVMVDVDALAKEHSMPKCANVMLLGAAARYLNILSVEELRESIARVFGTKGEAVVEMNRRAFDLGDAASDLK